MVMLRGFAEVVIFLILASKSNGQQSLPDTLPSEISVQDQLARQLQAATTGTPTESPAPSPSPSAAPTAKPSLTRKPTSRPTSNPTESPAPSPSPSATPTNHPTHNPTQSPTYEPTTTPYPTDHPTRSPTESPTSGPTQSPTDGPTISNQPSESPTDSPSVSPSSFPTVSAKPSASPSFAPSVSTAPSSAPTHIYTQSADWVFTLELTDTLNDTEVTALETGTETWMKQLELTNGGYLTDSDVQVTSQKLVEPSPFDRKLQETLESPDYTLLEIGMSATSRYTGPDVDFDLVQLEGPLQRNDPEWIHLLGNEDPKFLALRPSPDVTGISNDPFINEPAGKSGMSPALYGFTIFAATLAVVLGIVASVYSIRYHLHDARGTELVSPAIIMGHPPFAWSSEEEGGERSKASKSCGVPLGMDSVCCSNQTEEEVASVVVKNNEVFRSHDPRQSDPPTSEINFGRMSALFDKNDKNDENSNMSSAYADSRISAKPPPSKAAYLYPRHRVREEDNIESQEIDPTKSMRGTLGAAAVDGSATGQSDFTSQAKSFLQNVLGSNPNAGQQLPPASKNSVPSLIQRTMSYDSVLRKPGLYDVFAPAGPIGIVVDTTKEGPAVHSLKSSSPMLGLISPGDLIVGLDDEDTRSMTAATLTRLMARKSSQKERKITLLTSDPY